MAKKAQEENQENLSNIEMNIENLKRSIFTLENIREGGSIKRFNFTKIEMDNINFTIDMMKTNLDMLNEEKPKI